eukprot:PLAT1868.1.p1 GENE.PLAT1868.1~~PLAT1868.1.p1  ORF type:complete len:244 (+),score=78.27 PLAT1868.1:79-732(+)
MPELMEFVEEAGVNAVVKMNGWTQAIIFHCLHTDFDEAALWLIEQGADVHVRNCREQTPLSRTNSAAVAEALIAAGADLEARDEVLSTALHSASTTSGHHGVLACLIAHGADVDTVGWQGITPLMACARTCWTRRSLLMLLAAGADTSLKDEDGKTAEDLAVHNGYPEYVELIRAGKEAAAATLAAEIAAEKAAEEEAEKKKEAEEDGKEEEDGVRE